MLVMKCISALNSVDYGVPLYKYLYFDPLIDATLD